MEGGRGKERKGGKQTTILFNFNRTLKNLTEVRSVATFRLSQQLEFIAIMKQPSRGLFSGISFFKLSCEI